MAYARTEGGTEQAGFRGVEMFMGLIRKSLTTDI